MSNTEPMALCLFQCGHLTGEIGNWSVSDTGPMALCLFHCGHLTGEIGNWSRERAIQDQWLYVCFIVLSHWGKRETGPVSDTGPMALCLFHCGNLA